MSDHQQNSSQIMIYLGTFIVICFCICFNSRLNFKGFFSFGNFYWFCFHCLLAPQMFSALLIASLFCSFSPIHIWSSSMIRHPVSQLVFKHSYTLLHITPVKNRCHFSTFSFWLFSSNVTAAQYSF